MNAVPVTQVPPRAAARNARIDALRFAAIAMVVMTHVLNLRWEFKTLPLAPETVRAMMSFNMPLFAFVSGFVLLGREGSHPLRFIRGKALGLLVPYFAWIALEMPLRRITLAEAPVRLGRAAVDPLFGFQMWFLLVLFVCFVVFALSRWVSSSDTVTAGVAVAVGLLPLLPLPTWNLLGRLCWLYPFLVAGYLVATHREPLRRFDLLAAGAGLVAFPLLFASGWDGPIYRFAIGLAGTVALWGISRPLSQRVLEPLARAGQRTLGVYGWQMVILPFLIVGSGWLGAFISWALVLTGSLLLTLLLEQTVLTRAVFLGRWPKEGLRAAMARRAGGVKG